MPAPYLYIEVACLLVAVWCLRGAPRPWALLPGYLLVVVAVEAGGRWLCRGLGMGNHHLHNALLLVEGVFVPSFLYGLLNRYGPSRRHRNVWIGWLMVFATVFSVETFLTGQQRFNTITFNVLAVAAVLGSLYYYIRVAMDPPARSLWLYGPFWWVAGVLAFYAGTLFLHLLLPLLLRHPASQLGYRLYTAVVNTNIVLLYTAWIYASLCVYRNKN